MHQSNKNIIEPKAWHAFISAMFVMTAIIILYNYHRSNPYSGDISDKIDDIFSTATLVALGAYFFASPIVGEIADSFGRKIIIVASCIFIFIAYVIAGSEPISTRDIYLVAACVAISFSCINIAITYLFDLKKISLLIIYVFGIGILPLIMGIGLPIFTTIISYDFYSLIDKITYDSTHKCYHYNDFICVAIYIIRYLNNLLFSPYNERNFYFLPAFSLIISAFIISLFILRESMKLEQRRKFSLFHGTPVGSIAYLWSAKNAIAYALFCVSVKPGTGQSSYSTNLSWSQILL
jgi:MFS family permease